MSNSLHKWLASSDGRFRHSTRNALERNRIKCAVCIEILWRGKGVDEWRSIQHGGSSAEIIIPICIRSRHAGGRNESRERQSASLHLGLIIHEEECLIFLDRAAKRTTKLVQVELFRRGSEIASCVELGVAEEFKKRSVKLIAPRFGRDQNRWPGALAVFGGVVVGQDLEFLDGIDVREDRNSAFIQLVVVVAVEQPVGALFARAPDGQ